MEAKHSLPNTVLYNGHPGAELTVRCREVAVVGRFPNKSKVYGSAHGWAKKILAAVRGGR